MVCGYHSISANSNIDATINNFKNKFDMSIKDVLKNKTINVIKDLLSAKACSHKKGSVIEIFETDNLPIITGDFTKYYEGFCVDCKKKVYGRTGKTVIRWTTNRNHAFGL
jgi:hypothetical protein